MSPPDKIEESLLQKGQNSAELLHNLAPAQFEQLVADLLASFGWVVQADAKEADGGYDLLAISKVDPGLQVTWVVECKTANPSRAIGVEEFRRLYGAKIAAGASNGVLATTGKFTPGAKDFAESKSDLHLIDHDQIIAWLRQRTQQFTADAMN